MPYHTDHYRQPSRSRSRSRTTTHYPQDYSQQSYMYGSSQDYSTAYPEYSSHHQSVYASPGQYHSSPSVQHYYGGAYVSSSPPQDQDPYLKAPSNQVDYGDSHHRRSSRGRSQSRSINYTSYGQGPYLEEPSNQAGYESRSRSKSRSGSGSRVYAADYNYYPSDSSTTLAQSSSSHYAQAPSKSPQSLKRKPSKLIKRRPTILPDWIPPNAHNPLSYNFHFKYPHSRYYQVVNMDTLRVFNLTTGTHRWYGRSRAGRRWYPTSEHEWLQDFDQTLGIATKLDQTLYDSHGEARLFHDGWILGWKDWVDHEAWLCSVVVHKGWAGFIGRETVVVPYWAVEDGIVGSEGYEILDLRPPNWNREKEAGWLLHATKEELEKRRTGKLPLDYHYKGGGLFIWS